MSRKSKATDRAREEFLTGAGLAPSEVHEATTFDSTQPVDWWRRDWALVLLLVIVTMFAYLPAWNGTPIWDDDAHLTRPELRSLEGLAKIWTQPGATQQYYPLVHTLFWVEHRLWGDWPEGYHLLSILLHCTSALLLVRIFRQLEFLEPGWRPASLPCTQFKWNLWLGSPNSRTCFPACFIFGHCQLI